MKRKKKDEMVIRTSELNRRIKATKPWSDAKRFIFENMVIYSGGILVTLAWDFGIRLVKSGGGRIFVHEAGAHPVSFGLWQIAMLVFLGVQLLRYWSYWKYYD